MRGAPDCIGRAGETASTVEKLCMTGASLVENLTPKIFLSSDRVKIDAWGVWTPPFVICFA
jgi:hypothetical protein